MPDQWPRTSGTCRRPAKQLHTAREQLAELVCIHYPYHPRAGAEVEVLGRSQWGHDDFLIIRQPDGTRAHIPQWMTLASAASVSKPPLPRIPLMALHALRRDLDVVLSSLPCSTSPGGVDEAKQSDCATRPVQQRSSAASARESRAPSRRARRASQPAPVASRKQSRTRPTSGEKR